MTDYPAIPTTEPDEHPATVEPAPPDAWGSAQFGDALWGDEEGDN